MTIAGVSGVERGALVLEISGGLSREEQHMPLINGIKTFVWIFGSQRPKFQYLHTRNFLIEIHLTCLFKDFSLAIFKMILGVQ
jgi:hypothetical protein